MWQEIVVGLIVLLAAVFVIYRFIGNFKSNTFDLKIYSAMFINNLSVDNYSYILNKPITRMGDLFNYLLAYFSIIF